MVKIRQNFRLKIVTVCVLIRSLLSILENFQYVIKSWKKFYNKVNCCVHINYLCILYHHSPIFLMSVFILNSLILFISHYLTQPLSLIHFLSFFTLFMIWLSLFFSSLLFTFSSSLFFNFFCILYHDSFSRSPFFH